MLHSNTKIQQKNVRYFTANTKKKGATKIKAKGRTECSSLSNRGTMPAGLAWTAATASAAQRPPVPKEASNLQHSHTVRQKKKNTSTARERKRQHNPVPAGYAQYSLVPVGKISLDRSEEHGERGDERRKADQEKQSLAPHALFGNAATVANQWERQNQLPTTP